MPNLKTWKAKLEGRMPPDWAQEIDGFEAQIELNKQGKIEPRVFAETRLRRGAYGQRYDNGRRNDGKQVRQLAYPDASTWKGPDTHWHAPGMIRIKLPWGGTNAGQLETMADLAEEYSDGVAHITTRQDFQLHFVHIEDTPDLMRRLADCGITSREACGNSVRNVTACPLADVCAGETFDVTPYAEAIFRFLLGHPDAQDFGRKFKVAFSGCENEGCGLVMMHDMGFIAKVRDGKRGFDAYVGGGLGPVPYQAKKLLEFVDPDEILPLTQAVARVFGRLGEKKNRGAARIKFLVAKLGIDEFRRLVLEERKTLPADPRWVGLPAAQLNKKESPLRVSGTLPPSLPEGFLDFARQNVRGQAQAGYSTVAVQVPLGDLTSSQLRALAEMTRKYTKDTVRTTVEQNLLFRWIAQSDLPALYSDLRAVGLAAPNAGTISDITSCPGTDTCKLGIAASRGLGRRLSEQMDAKLQTLPPEVRNLKIKVSGCPNSCGQHPLSDLGFFGVSRKAGGYAVPHFQVVLGGQWENNGGAYGQAVIAVPSKRIPQVVDRLLGWFTSDRQDGESFGGFVKRVGKVETKNRLQDLAVVPSHDVEPDLYQDWGDPREFTIGDIGKGECAGEVVTPSEFSVTAAESEIFEAQVALDGGNQKGAVGLAYQAMIHSAEACVRSRLREYVGGADETVSKFRALFHETGDFAKHATSAQFAGHFFRHHEQKLENPDRDEAGRRVQEAQLFLEAVQTFLNA